MGIILLLNLLAAAKASETEEETCDAGHPLTVTVYPNGGDGDGTNMTVTRKELDEIGSFYNEAGVKVLPENVENHTVLYKAPTKKGLHFVYPTLPIGTRIPTNLTSPSGKEIELEVLSHSPRVFYVHNFMSEAETDTLIEWSTSDKNPYKMAPSTAGTHKSWSQGGRDDKISTRTSMNAFDVATQTSSDIKKRTFELLRIPKFQENMADGIQVLRYETSQAYIAHHDYFPVRQSEDFNWDPSRGGSNRFATVFLYLSNVEAGGQTCFPKKDRLTQEDYPELMERLGGNTLAAEGIEELLKQAGIAPNSWEAKLTRNCYTKFAIPPKSGDAVLFYSQTPDGHLDPNSLHGAGPVLKGTKWGANVWVWNACRYSTCKKDPMQPAEEIDFEY
jgi:prolyl 4-hydroxylase